MDRTDAEKGVMLLITGLTNVVCFPALYVLYHKKLLLQFYMGLFTFATSFMYHCLDSLWWNKFYLNRGNWHRLDNIGSIMCFIMLLVYLMDNLHREKGIVYSSHRANVDMHLNMVGLLITMLLQEKAPWEIENTVAPILLFAALLLGKSIIKGVGRFNRHYLVRGVWLMGLGVVGFVKGLDDRNDYLRVWHGMWHCCIGIGSFYMWQCIDKDRELKSSCIVEYSSQTRFHFKEVSMKILKLQFFKEHSK